MRVCVGVLRFVVDACMAAANDTHRADPSINHITTITTYSGRPAPSKLEAASPCAKGGTTTQNIAVIHHARTRTQHCSHVYIMQRTLEGQRSGDQETVLLVPGVVVAVHLHLPGGHDFGPDAAAVADLCVFV